MKQIINKTTARTLYRKGKKVYANGAPMKPYKMGLWGGKKLSGHAFSYEGDRLRELLKVNRLQYSFYGSLEDHCTCNVGITNVFHHGNCIKCGLHVKDKFKRKSFYENI